MKKKLFKVVSLIISVVLLSSVIIGCGNGNAESNQAVSTPSTQAASTSSTTAVPAPIYPIKTTTTLKYWSALSENVSTNFKSLGDTPYAQELEKETGVKVEYLHPTVGQEGDSFNIMIASNDLPDIIEYYWSSFPGGIETAIQDKVILKLNDTIDKYAPNLKQYLASNSEANKMIKTDNASYYGFPFINGDPTLVVYQGLAIRNDWLKDLGLQIPTTMDDWYNTLKAFKEKKKSSAPFSIAGAGDPLYQIGTTGTFMGAYGVKKDFYVEDGKVKYGPNEPRYKDWLAEMAKWYSEGLIDKNFATLDGDTLDSQVINGRTGAILGFAGGGIGRYTPLLKEKDPNADLEPAPYPVLKKGDVPKFGQRAQVFTGLSAAITSQCKDVELAARWLDYNYSEKGNLLNNFGIPGVSYNMENGYPKMTDEVLKNPNELPVGQAWSKYARSPYEAPYVKRKEYLEQYYALQSQKDAVKIWSSTDAAKYTLPPITLTKEEGDQNTKIYNDIYTYVNEYSLKVIMGVEKIDSFDGFINQLKKMNIDQVIAIQQAGLDRYNSR